jgi:hypothetical protein
MSSRFDRRQMGFAILVVVVLASAWPVWRNINQARPSLDGTLPITKAESSSSRADKQMSPSPGREDLANWQTPTTEGTWHELLALLDSLADTRTPDDAKAGLAQLRSWLHSLGSDEAVALIHHFLESGNDATLPFEFTVGNDGFLAVPPSLRVALLDELGRIDTTSAARIGREVLTERTSPDEWAVALRNVARGESAPETAGYLRTKTEELIRDPNWQASPSIGYLNAFDVLVHVGATESIPLLSELLQLKERRDLAHASFLTLDRLTQHHPVETLKRIAADPVLQTSRPEMVAQQFARADLRNPGQRELVRTWLTSPERGRAELMAFAGVFPNSNRIISRNLLTEDQPLSGRELRDHDLEVARIVNAWLEDPAFDSVEPHLQVIAQRMRAFTAPPPGAGPSPAPD